jgi:hypothetical protein
VEILFVSVAVLCGTMSSQGSGSFGIGLKTFFYLMGAIVYNFRSCEVVIFSRFHIMA